VFEYIEAACERAIAPDILKVALCSVALHVLDYNAF
jgi:hypothetical protein